MTNKLAEFNLGSDKHTFLSRLIKNIFSVYLENYIEMERQYLQSRSAMILQRYYDSKNHQKRLLGTGRFVCPFSSSHSLRGKMGLWFLSLIKLLMTCKWHYVNITYLETSFGEIHFFESERGNLRELCRALDCFFRGVGRVRT